MIVDTSAVVAVLAGEPQRADLLAALSQAAALCMSAGTYLETAIVVDRLNDPVLSRQLDALLEHLEVEIVPVDHAQARMARAAYRDFGKGSGHPAGLSLGDCFAYALAQERREELLFVGNDFGQTDVRRAPVAAGRAGSDDHWDHEPG